MLKKLETYEKQKRKLAKLVNNIPQLILCVAKISEEIMLKDMLFYKLNVPRSVWSCACIIEHAEMNRLCHLYLSLQEKIQVWHTKLVTKQFEQEKLLLSRTFQKTDVLHYVGCKQNLPTNRLKDWLTNKKFLLSRPWTKVTKICNK